MSKPNAFHTVQLPPGESAQIPASLRPYLTGGSAKPKKHPTKAPTKRKLAMRGGQAKKRRRK